MCMMCMGKLGTPRTWLAARRKFCGAGPLKLGKNLQFLDVLWLKVARSVQQNVIDMLPALTAFANTGKVT
jgi:hypothetical protein